MDLDIIWKEYYKYCMEKMGAEDKTAEIYLQTCMPLSLEEGVLVLDVATQFAMDQIKSRYLARMKELLIETSFGTDIKLKISSDQPEATKVQEPQPKNPQSKPSAGRNGLNPNYVFSTFVVGKSNRLPHAASLAVAESPGNTYNPFFIWGKVGLGKTHLMHAIGHHIAATNNNTKILYVSAEKFTNDLITAIRNNTNQEFRARYRELDVLMIDDVQFIAGKEQTQEEFFHTFNSLYEAGKQIVLTSDRPPREMTKLEDRLRTRFEWGLMVDVTPPDYETRLAIVKNKSAMLGVKLSDPVSDLIAENVTANVRQIEGTLNKILAYYDLMGSTMSQEDILKAIRDMIKKNNEYIPTAQAVVNYICSTYHIDEDVLRGQSRGREVVNARQIAMYLMRRMICMNLVDIGKEFGDRDHTTVLHSLDKVEKQMRSDPAFAETVKQITTNINNSARG